MLAPYSLSTTGGLRQKRKTFAGAKGKRQCFPNFMTSAGPQKAIFVSFSNVKFVGLVINILLLLELGENLSYQFLHRKT